MRAKNYDGNDDDWEAIVARSFHQEMPESNRGQPSDGLEVVSSVGDNQLTITIRKNIGGITV